MKRLIYQVCLGKESSSKLYKHCIDSVARYCEQHGIEHRVQTKPLLRIKPDVFSTNRSQESYEKHGGFLPIYEKEHAFDLIDDYDQIAIVDADIYVRDGVPNLFDDFGTEHAWGGVAEREMPITHQYAQKIINYSHMQYHKLHINKVANFRPNNLGYEFFNMGLIVINCAKFKKYLKGQSSYEFINRMEFKDFVDGVGPYKWSTDQTLLNYFLKKYDVPTKHLSWKWNALYKGVMDSCMSDSHFVHFFLKDKLPGRGENVEELMELVKC